MHVGDDADDFRGQRHHARDELLAKRILAGREELLGHRFADDDDRSARHVVVLVEVASGLERNAKHVEPVRADQVAQRERPLGQRRQRTPDHRVRRRSVVAAERRVVAERDGFRARHRLQRVVQAHVEIRGLLGAGRILRRRQDRKRGEDALGAKARLDVLNAHDSRDHETGRDEQHERDRDLADQERAAEAVVLAAGGRFAARILQRIVRGVHRRVHRRYQTHHNADQYRHAERESDHDRIERDLVRARNEVVAQMRQQRQRDCREDEADHSAGEREHQAFDEELRDDAAALGAEREADADFLAPAREAREQQIGDVRARDQQHARDRGEQHAVGLALVADEIVLQVAGEHLRRRVDVLRVRLRVARRNDVHRGAHLIHADAGLEAPDRGEKQPAVVDLLLREKRAPRTDAS